MVQASKVALALTVVASAVVGSYLLITLGTREVKEAFVLSSRDDLNGSYESGKFGNDYAIYMVDPDNEKNKWWWEESYKNLKSDISNSDKRSKLYEAFYKGGVEKVNLGFGTTEDSLNKVCDVAFKKKPSDLSEEHYGDNVWAYCSVVGAKYTFVADDDYAGKFGSKLEHKNKILSVKNSDNESFWAERNKQFFGRTGKDGSGADASAGSEFKKLYAKGVESNGEGVDSVKKKCEDAYDVVVSDTSIVKDEDIKRFCYLIPE
ncbi:hypothetical protein [Candidatus Mycoplasma haematohominis]|uniref:Uncharacterized protein n=1 Tax=Candidatus Mycoplasma haematohominis TaxID=1494318 RepID=A0A478FQN1_9MOLU|nr:hypothetical protein [Candidatus Mycoplasma haemohominis]GCE63662.1 hypothetical protein MHSWG343_06620 [Candidatus Mycoplasma haemohominis]